MYMYVCNNDKLNYNRLHKNFHSMLRDRQVHSHKNKLKTTN